MNSGAPPRTGPALFAQAYQSGKKGAIDRWLQTELRLSGLCVSVDSNQGPVDSYTQSQLSGF
ncbi:hypothetical protein Taro_025264 [Colocasia esculenta]|uniref:Uncharacterized protein n=1 Tax=Colocasia esculenta TaxID=4460 RepID=A0A843VG16_COLES|nr:hypothetical protein [Colocasia esculenta]